MVALKVAYCKTSILATGQGRHGLAGQRWLAWLAEVGQREATKIRHLPGPVDAYNMSLVGRSRQQSVTTGWRSTDVGQEAAVAGNPEFMGRRPQDAWLLLVGSDPDTGQPSTWPRAATDVAESSHRGRKRSAHLSVRAEPSSIDPGSGQGEGEGGVLQHGSADLEMLGVGAEGGVGGSATALSEHTFGHSGHRCSFSGQHVGIPAVEQKIKVVARELHLAKNRRDLPPAALSHLGPPPAATATIPASSPTNIPAGPVHLRRASLELLDQDRRAVHFPTLVFGVPHHRRPLAAAATFPVTTATFPVTFPVKNQQLSTSSGVQGTSFYTFPARILLFRQASISLVRSVGILGVGTAIGVADLSGARRDPTNLVSEPPWSFSTFPQLPLKKISVSAFLEELQIRIEFEISVLSDLRFRIADLMDLRSGRTTLPGRMDIVQASPQVEADPSLVGEVPSVELETQAVGRMVQLENEVLKMRQEMSEYKQQLSKLDELNDIKEMLRAMNANQASNQRPAPAPPSQVTPAPRPDKQKGVLGGPPSADPTPPPWHMQAGPSRPQLGWNPEHFEDYHGTNGGHNGQHVDPTVNIGGPSGHHNGYNGHNGGQQHSTSGFGNRETYGPQASQYGPRFGGTQWENANTERRCKNIRVYTVEQESYEVTEGEPPLEIEVIDEPEILEELLQPEEVQPPPEGACHMMNDPKEPDAMKVVGRVGNLDVLVLLDSGATHNFVGEHIADRLGSIVQEQSALRILVANGDSLPCTRRCTDVELILQKVPFKVELLVVPLPNVDIILGVKWLKTLGRVWWDFSTKEMCLPKEGGEEVVLKGIDPTLEPKAALKAIMVQQPAA
ncbi:hypothetical protein EJ110_NYTH53430 [Nymphaea thermarum]|nr:hypothetical protein EJ110_NYTH53430 [Nymphaea thermarum]